MKALRRLSVSPVVGLFSRPESHCLRAIPGHLLADCGFEAMANRQAMNQEIDRLALKLSSLR